MEGVARRRVGWQLRLESLDVAVVAEKVAFERIAAVTFLIIQLKTTILTVVALHMVVLVHRNNPDGLFRTLGWKDGLIA